MCVKVVAVDKEQLIRFLAVTWIGDIVCWRNVSYGKQEVKVIWQKAPHGGPFPG